MNAASPLLIAVEDDPDSPIWLVDGVSKRHILDWESFQKLGFDLAKVRKRPLREIARMPNGPPLMAR